MFLDFRHRFTVCLIALLWASPSWAQFRDITPGRTPADPVDTQTEEPTSTETAEATTTEGVTAKSDDAPPAATTTESNPALPAGPVDEVLAIINPATQPILDAEAAAIIGAINPPNVESIGVPAHEDAALNIIANPLATVVETTTTTQTTVADKNYLVGEALSEQTIELDAEDEGPVRPVRFNGVIVGKTVIEKVEKLWGVPFKIVRGEQHDIYKYRRDPFRQVDLTVLDGKVIDVLIHLKEALDPNHCARELGLNDLTAVPVPDDFGQVMGLSYPERGVLFSFLAGDPDSLVSKIHLEPINPEPFLLRAQYDFDRNFEQDLADINTAVEMSPNFARAFWVKAEVLEKLGRYHDALDAANQAINLAPEDGLYLLTRSRILRKNGEYEAATTEVRRILKMEDLSQDLQAMAELQMGNLIAEGSVPRFKKAMQHHLRAIDLAAPIANERQFAARRLAKQVLVDAHLAVARNISRGDYQRQNEVAPRWLSRGRALVEEYVKRDQGDPALRLKVHRYIMATAADLYNMDDPARIINDMVAEGRRLIDEASDPLNASRLEWELGHALAEAVRLQRSRGAYDEAIELADEALVLMQHSAKKRQSTAMQKLVVGRLYFHVGSLQAVHQKNHEEAIEWYEKAQSLLMKDVPTSVFANPQVFGEYFISMGVSYWSQHKQERAIELTEFGTDIIQQAVSDGILPKATLAIPYGNLASMHHQAGHDSDARAFAELAADINADETSLR